MYNRSVLCFSHRKLRCSETHGRWRLRYRRHTAAEAATTRPDSTLVAGRRDVIAADERQQQRVEFDLDDAGGS